MRKERGKERKVKKRGLVCGVRVKQRDKRFYLKELDDEIDNSSRQGI